MHGYIYTLYRTHGSPSDPTICGYSDIIDGIITIILKNGIGSFHHIRYQPLDQLSIAYQGSYVYQCMGDDGYQRYRYYIVGVRLAETSGAHVNSQ